MRAIPARIAEDNSECSAECREAMGTEKERDGATKVWNDSFFYFHYFSSVLSDFVFKQCKEFTRKCKLIA